MADTDEMIIQLKKEVRNQQFMDIETTGIYVHDKLIQFGKQQLFGKQLSVWIPVEFIDMPEAIRLMKYPSVERPQVIKTSLDTTVNFSFKRVDEKVGRERIEELAGLLKQVLKSANPRIRFSQEDTIQTSSGNNVSLFSFTNSCIDESIYNLFCVMDVSGGVIQGVFNCLEQDSEQWESAAWSVFSKMEENKKNT